MVQTLEEETISFNQKTAKLAEIIDIYGVNSPEFESYRKKHCNNKFGLLYIYRRFGIKSNIFFKYIKPFLIKQMNRFTYNPVTDDTISECYIHLVNAHCGYYTNKLDSKGNRIWKDAWVDDMNTISPSKWINFIITICRSTVSGRDYHSNKHNLEISHNDRIDDFLGHSLIDNFNYSSFSMKHFIFEKSMQSHLEELMSNRPSNNVLYNMIQWSILENDEVAQAPTSYKLLGEKDD